MKSQYVNQLQDRDSVDTQFFVAEKMLLKDKNSRPYLSISLRDVTGTINARVWDRAEEMTARFESGDFIKAGGHVQVYQGRKQLVLTSIDRLQTGQFDVRDFLRASKKDPNEMYSQLLEEVSNIKEEPLKQLVQNTVTDETIKALILKCPAAKSIHHAYVGGLLEHVLSICGIMNFLSQHYDFLNRDYLIFGAIFHDLGKVFELTVAEGISYTDSGRLVGHMAQACAIIDEKSQDIPDFSDSLRDLCKHIVLSHHGRLEYGSPKRPKFLEAYVVAMVDDLDSKLNTIVSFMEEELKHGEDWTHYNGQFDRYFYLGILREQLKKARTIE